MLKFFLLTILSSFLTFSLSRPALSQDLSFSPLAEILPVYDPTLTIPANSEWSNPVMLDSQQGKILLPAPLLKQLPKLLRQWVKGQKLKTGRYQLEMYPVRGDGNGPHWQVARWRFSQPPAVSWQWSHSVKEIDPWQSESHWRAVFGPMEQLDLYDKPLYSQCLFLDRARPMQLLQAWDWKTAWSDLSTQAQEMKKSRPRCRLLPAPPLLHGRYHMFNLTLTVDQAGGLRWRHEDAGWQQQIATDSRPVKLKNIVPSSRLKDQQVHYQRELEICAGEKPALMPTGEELSFKRKNSWQADHQLNLMLDYYEQKYQTLGLYSWRQTFYWQGIKQQNLITVIAPSNIEAKKRAPIIIADHFDTAFSEDIWSREKKRVSNPGADDNCSATAGLLLLARALAAEVDTMERPVWLVHLTGEEFPADDLGARHLISYLLEKKIRPEIVMVIDMIAYTPKPADSKVFQISLGQGAKAEHAGLLAQSVARTLGRQKLISAQARLRPRFDPHSFLHQTDAVIFSDYDLPVLLFNEHLNERHNWERAHYHQSSDSTATLNISYAMDILQVVLETARLAARSK